MGLSDISFMVLLVTPLVPLAHPPCGQGLETEIRRGPTGSSGRYHYSLPLGRRPNSTARTAAWLRPASLSRAPQTASVICGVGALLST